MNEFSNQSLMPQSSINQSQILQLLQYSPIPIRKSSLVKLSASFSSLISSTLYYMTCNQIELLRVLRSQTMNPQQKDMQFLVKHEIEIVDFSQELEKINFSCE